MKVDFNVCNSVYAVNTIKYSNDVVKPIINNHRDKVSFSGNYISLMNEIVEKNVSNVTDVEKSFGRLLKAIVTDDSITKEKWFSDIKTLYDRKGFKEMMQCLIQKSHESNNIDKMYKNVLEFGQDCEHGLVLAKNKNKPALSIDDYNRIFGIDNSEANHPIITFYGDENTLVEFSITPKGKLEFQQTGKDIDINTSFHKTGGNREKVIYNNKYSQDVIYYNKDGSENFLKNWFFGGTTVIPE